MQFTLKYCGLWTHLFLPTMIMNIHCMADHDIAEASNSNRHQPVPGVEQVQEEGVHQAGGRGVEQDPRGLEDGGLDAGGDVDDAVADDQAVHPAPLLPQDADARPQVDDEGDQGEEGICNKVTPRLCHIHLK